MYTLRRAHILVRSHLALLLAHSFTFQGAAGGGNFGNFSMLGSKMPILYAGDLLGGVNRATSTSSVNMALPPRSPSSNTGSFTSSVSHNHSVAY